MEQQAKYLTNEEKLQLQVARLEQENKRLRDEREATEVELAHVFSENEIEGLMTNANAVKRLREELRHRAAQRNSYKNLKEKAEQENQQLRGILDEIVLGGNYLENILRDREIDPGELTEYQALELAPDLYSVWTCWRTIEQGRKALEGEEE